MAEEKSRPFLGWRYNLFSYESISSFWINGAKVTISRENYAQTLTDSTMDFSITAEEIRGGQGEIAPYVE